MRAKVKRKTKRRPGLLPQHLADLRNSGLDDDTIAANGFFSITSTDELKRILGRRVSSGLVPAMAIRFRSRDGEFVDYVRVKPDNPRKYKDKSVRYESPSGKPSHAYFPPGTVKALSNPDAPLIVTEGEKKAAKADQEGFACVGLVGVFGWKLKDEDRLIPDLEQIVWRGRSVFIAFDSDAIGNSNVLRAERRLAALLDAQGADVQIIRIPSLGKEPIR